MCSNRPLQTCSVDAECNVGIECRYKMYQCRWRTIVNACRAGWSNSKEQAAKGTWPFVNCSFQ